MTTFTCKNENCSNCGIEYNFEGKVKSAECGGCHKTLKGVYVADPAPVEEVPVDAQ